MIWSYKVTTCPQLSHEGRTDLRQITSGVTSLHTKSSSRAVKSSSQHVSRLVSCFGFWYVPLNSSTDGCSGFIPKSLFLEQMETNRESVNVFLLLSILGISARFTPELCERFQGCKNASEFFLDVAHILIAEEMWNTSLENAQAFFLLGMAAVLRLHREETYQLPADASADQVVDAERARRTFWVIQSHDNLYAQQHLPLSFSKSDITALLPCNESDFAFGRHPRYRAALSGTIPALKDGSLERLPDRSLFATLVQAHDLWGAIARDASRDGQTGIDPEPWQPNSHYMCTAMRVSSWEDNIPREHKWSAWNLRGYKAEHVDLAYLSIVTITRLNNIVLRRAYMDHVFRSATRPLQSSSTGAEALAPPGFWEQMSLELFRNAWSLYEAVNMWLLLRSEEDGFPAMLAFCIYICGSLASHLHKWPGLCPGFNSAYNPSAETILHRSLEVLSMFEDKWSTASQWSRVLREALALDQPLDALSRDIRPLGSSLPTDTQPAAISSPTVVDFPPPVHNPFWGNMPGTPHSYSAIPFVEALSSAYFQPGWTY